VPYIVRSTSRQQHLVNGCDHIIDYKGKRLTLGGVHVEHMNRAPDDRIVRVVKIRALRLERAVLVVIISPVAPGDLARGARGLAAQDRA
jgi:hypothetical protein